MAANRVVAAAGDGPFVAMIEIRAIADGTIAVAIELADGWNVATTMLEPEGRRLAMDLLRACDESRAAAVPRYACPRCHMTSYNSHDVAQRYCGHCHRFEDSLI